MKKFISSILTVTLLASCITFSSIESKVKAESTTATDSNSQIIKNGEINPVTNDKVTTLKTIEGTDVENVFNITLQVTTEEDIKNISISPDAATVLVLDRSGSMNEGLDGSTRFEKMKEAANNFLTGFVKVEEGSSAKRLVSIVSFSSDVKNETYSNGVNNWIDITKDLTSAQSKINGLKNSDGGTNIEGALIMANNIVKDGKDKSKLLGSDGKEIKNINIILLTDGSPTFHAKDSNTKGIDTIEGVIGGGNKAYTSDWKPVGGTVEGVSVDSNNISKIIKDSGINLYTIAFSTTNEKFYTKDPSGKNDNGNSTDLNPSEWMGTFATRNFSANNTSDLIKQFEKINKLIALSAQAWKVTDPMGDNIIYKDAIDPNSYNAYSLNDTKDTLTWDLKSSTPVEGTTTEGNKKYTYTLKYGVALDTTNENGNYYNVQTNGETILYYYLFSKQGNEESVELKQTNFKIPEVKGLFGEFNFTKINEKNEAMSGVQFILTGTATGSDIDLTRNVTSDVSGKVAFTNIPAGVYTLTEKAVNGYVGAGPWTVTVSYGNVTKDSKLGDTIVNYPTSRNISVEKVWTGLQEGETDLPQNVTVKLYENNEDTGEILVLNSSNNWKETFSNLPYIDENGVVINYSVVEVNVEGYETVIIVSDDGNEVSITNKYNPELISINGNKTWVNQSGTSMEGSVPDIEITLQRTTADNWDDASKIEDVQTIKLTNGNTEYSFENLPKTATNSEKYKYRVRESEVNGYVATYNDKFDITNTYTPGNKQLSVNKVWENVDEANDTLPTVRVILYQDGKEYRSQELIKTTRYSYTFENLPKYRVTGDEYKYTVEEKMQHGTVGYTSEIGVNSDGSVTITNTFNTQKISITGTKVWNNVPSGSEVPEVTLHLYQNGVELKDKVVTLNSGIKENGTESYTFMNLPKYSTDGTEYVYTIKEDSINGYTSTGEANAQNDYVITNTYNGGEKVVINGTKTWINVKDTNKVPDITIRVLRDGEEIHSIVVPSGTTTYEIALDTMIKYAIDGHEYEYILTEDKIDEFESVRDGYNFTNTLIDKEDIPTVSGINTGDNNMTILYSSLVIISLISIIALKKKKKSLIK